MTMLIRAAGWAYSADHMEVFSDGYLNRSSPGFGFPLNRAASESVEDQGLEWLTLKACFQAFGANTTEDLMDTKFAEKSAKAQALVSDTCVFLFSHERGMKEPQQLYDIIHSVLIRLIQSSPECSSCCTTAASSFVILTMWTSASVSCS